MLAWKTMLEKIKSIEENDTWKLVNLPTSHRPMGLKWVFMVKRDEHGVIARHKARLVAKWYVQCQGIDFNEVFAPISQIEYVCLLLAVVAHEGWEVHHIDVKTAFLNGDLTKEVYVTQPLRFFWSSHENKVLKLRNMPNVKHWEHEILS